MAEVAEVAEVVMAVAAVEVVAEVDPPARSGRGQARRVAVDARQGTRDSTQGDTAPAAPAATETSAVAEVRVPGRSGRGSAERATGRPGDTGKDVASITR